MEKEVNWDDMSFIHRSKHRETILKLLDSPKTPTMIKRETGMHFAQASRTLTDLEKKGFVKCLTPGQKLARFYGITEKGKEIVKD